MWYIVHLLLLLSSRTCPSTILTSTSGTPIHRSVAITIYLGTVSKAFSRSMNPRAILPCTSSLFSTICPRTYIPSAVPLPFLNPCCSSPKSHSTLLLILASKILYSAKLQYLAEKCDAPVLSWVMHITIPLPYQHCQAHPPLFLYPSLLHTHVHLTPTSPAIPNISSRTSSAPVASPLSSCALLFSQQSSKQLAAPFPFSSSFKFAAHILNISVFSVMSLPLLSLITAPLFKSLPPSVPSRAILNIIFLPPSSSSFRYSSSSILLRALSTVLLAAFFFWPYRCFKPVDGCSPLL